MRSGIMEYSIPRSLSTPSMRMLSVPAPLTLAPIPLRKMAKSTTSGSLAAFSSTVVPSAKEAAIIKLIVVPTLALLT